MIVSIEKVMSAKNISNTLYREAYSLDFFAVFLYNASMNSKLIMFNTVAIIASFVFSLFQINFVGDISFIAFPLSLVFVLWYAYESHIQLCKHLKLEKLSLVVKLLQYLPYVLLASFVFRRTGEFGTAFWYDIITVTLWVIVMISSHGVLYFLSHKRVFEKNPELQKIAEHSPKKPLPFFKKVVYEIFDWIDAFIQAICAVVLINIFIFQLYEIPSESMVSEFLVRDRVVGLKIDAGPKFPLSDVGIPEIRSFDRGDIVIFSNPHYSDDRDSKIQSFVSQLVYMLTLTMVNLNVDESGQLKADPLVKRVTGVEGEQLVMQDGILYSRTQESAHFTPVVDDALWAEWNIAALPQSILEKVKDVPLKTYEYDTMLAIEHERSMLNLQEAREEAESLVARFSPTRQARMVAGDAVSLDSYSDANSLHVYSFFSHSSSLIWDLYFSDDGIEWFSAFMTDWIDAIPQEAFTEDAFVNGDIYSDAMFRHNLMLKLRFGRLAVRTVELLNSGVYTNDQLQDAQMVEYMSDAQNLIWYMLFINDMRNMSVFPPNDGNGNAQYISKDNFFVMGDNRFNSHDMRHSYDSERRRITAFDPWSFYYDSKLKPQLISTADILGTPVLRFYPFSRFGVPGTGK